MRKFEKKKKDIEKATFRSIVNFFLGLFKNSGCHRHLLYSPKPHVCPKDRVRDSLYLKSDQKRLWFT